MGTMDMIVYLRKLFITKSVLSVKKMGSSIPLIGRSSYKYTSNWQVAIIISCILDYIYIYIYHILLCHILHIICHDFLLFVIYYILSITYCLSCIINYKLFLFYVYLIIDVLCILCILFNIDC